MDLFGTVEGLYRQIGYELRLFVLEYNIDSRRGIRVFYHPASALIGDGGALLTS
jgi:hypothetical protein